MGAVCGFFSSMMERRPLQEPQMDRQIEEADYILKNLYRARQEVVANPAWLEPDALRRIDNAIALIEKARLVAKAA